jgi:hypothetical protein
MRQSATQNLSSSSNNAELRNQFPLLAEENDVYVIVVHLIINCGSSLSTIKWVSITLPLSCWRPSIFKIADSSIHRRSELLFPVNLCLSTWINASAPPLNRFGCLSHETDSNWLFCALASRVPTFTWAVGEFFGREGSPLVLNGIFLRNCSFFYQQIFLLESIVFLIFYLFFL